MPWIPCLFNSKEDQKNASESNYVKYIDAVDAIAKDQLPEARDESF